MGANYSNRNDGVCVGCQTLYRRAEGKELKDTRQRGQSPRDLLRGELRERRPIDRIEAKDGALDPLGGDMISIVPEREATDGNSAFQPRADSRKTDDGAVYNPLSLQDDVPVEDMCQNSPTMRCSGKCSEQMMLWREDWLHDADSGELDIYTCWGLSNCFNCTPDNSKLILKVIGVSVLQLVVPCILLRVELEHGFSYNPRVPALGFRVMGFALYLYSVWNMYNNSLDECRSELLQWALCQGAPSGYWVPMLVGELTNVFVSLILVLTLFVIFVETEDATELIFNAVAVNFLGAVDGEFVDEDMKNAALENFKNLFRDYGSDEDSTADHRDRTWLQAILESLLTLIAVSGLILSITFLFAPSRGHEDSKNIGKGSYPKLI